MQSAESLRSCLPVEATNWKLKLYNNNHGFEGSDGDTYPVYLKPDNTTEKYVAQLRDARQDNNFQNILHELAKG